MRSSMTNDRQACGQHDWAGARLTLAVVWGLPSVAMLLALLLEPLLRAAVWITMLAWMGAACMTNARRCGRTHCRYTGPFFLGMAALVLAYAVGIVQLGNQPWIILGLLTVVGNALSGGAASATLAPTLRATANSERVSSAHRPCCPRPRRQRCCSGRFLPLARSCSGRSTAGRRSPSSWPSQLTSPPDALPSPCRRRAHQIPTTFGTAPPSGSHAESVV